MRGSGPATRRQLRGRGRRPSAPSHPRCRDPRTVSPSATTAPDPSDGRMPTTLQNDAGLRSEPPMSEPSAIGIIPVASATAAPPLEPPHVFVRSYGLRVAPNTGLNVCEPAPNSGVFVLPIVTAPAARSRCTMSSSSVGTKSSEERRAQRGADALRRARGPCARPAARAAGRSSPRGGAGVGLGGPRLGHLRHQRDDGIDGRVHGVDPPQARGQQLARRHLATADHPRQLDRAPVDQFRHLSTAGSIDT